MNETSFWTARLGFPSDNSSDFAERDTYSTRQLNHRQDSDSVILWYNEPIHYTVSKTGYYCVGTLSSTMQWRSLTEVGFVAVVPVTVISSERRDEFNPSYNGVILFQNTFNGKLPASEHPKVNVR